MVSEQSSIPVAGSEKAPLPGARAVGPSTPDERLEVTVRVRPRSTPKALIAMNALADVHPKERNYMTREQYESDHGSDPEDLAKVAEFATKNGIAVVQSSAARRTVILSGDVKAFSRAFGVELEQFEHAGGTYRGRTGAVHVPAELAEIIVGVFGLDNRPQAKPHFMYGPQEVATVGAAKAHAAITRAFSPIDVAKLYHYPAGLDGTGQCIAIIELGGTVNNADLQHYFTSLGIHQPNVSIILVDHAQMQAGPADGEVMLDIEVAAAIAPKARIVVYFAPNTSQGFLDAITRAIHDNINKPSVISISWGNAEKNWTAQAQTQFNQAFQAAAALGISICCASGDNGSSDGETDGHAHVDFPSSSPFALGCGGTRLLSSGISITSETVWNDNPTQSATGGGISHTFPVQSYQNGAHIPASANPGGQRGRGVPDVSGNADPNTGYKVRVDGQDTVIGGTSAVAPLMAGLIALINQRIGKPVGFLNPLLYGSLAAKGVVRDIINGNNGAYQARQGWDACTGLGVIDGAKLLQELK